MISISHNVTRTSSLKNFLMTALLSTAMTFALEAVGSDGEKEDSSISPQHIAPTLKRAHREDFRERWIPYLMGLAQEESAWYWEDEQADPVQLKIFMNDMDCILRLRS